MIILFDTDCVLCSGGAAFVLRHERDTQTRFVSAWSEQGMAIAARHALSVQDLDLTFLVIDGDTPRIKSDAALAVMRHLRAPWRWGRVARLVPRGLRDAVYGLVARHRYRWFGKRTSCRLPTAAEPERFLP